MTSQLTDSLHVWDHSYLESRARRLYRCSDDTHDSSSSGSGKGHLLSVSHHSTGAVVALLQPSSIKHTLLDSRKINGKGSRKDGSMCIWEHMTRAYCLLFGKVGNPHLENQIVLP